MNGKIRFLCSGVAVLLLAALTFSCKGKTTNNSTEDSDTTTIQGVDSRFTKEELCS